AGHNLELAKLLWVKAKANPRKKQENPPGGDDDSQPRDGSGDPGDDGRDPGRLMRASADRQPGMRPDGSPEPIPTNERQPGTGSLPPVPDKDALAPLSAEDAARHLERAAARIAQERRKRQAETIVAPPPNVKDW